MIQSIIRLTRAKSVDDYVQAIEGRIKALARAHTLLSDSRWHGADLGTLVAEELAPYRAGDKIQCSGPDISLQPATAQGLALAVHELATNAAKHGALSSPAGKIRLDWQLQADALKLHWVENGGPIIGPPSVRSFGLKVIVASIEQQLGGKAAFDGTGKVCAARSRYRAATDKIPRLQPARTAKSMAAPSGSKARTGRASFWSRTRRWSP